ncbi:MAG: S-adenosylmethionine decarboxylase [Hyphomicrobiales bacterium]|nr:S-adenosylmethionine decarboxylase [Hyphomicrobiales bacterium]
MLIVHALAEVYGCQAIIEDAAKLVEAAKTAAAAVGARTVGEFQVKYEPQGLTIAVFLAESHIIITTWPEYQLALIDVLMCNSEMDYNQVVRQIREQISPDGHLVMHTVPRNIAASP